MSYVVETDKHGNAIPPTKKSPYKRGRGYVNLIMFDLNGYPSCEKHGAMNCVNKERSLWRCLTCGVGVSFGSVEAFDTWLASHRRPEKEPRNIQ
jgi:hypothetical protein